MQVNIYNDILYNTNKDVSTSIVLQDKEVSYSGNTNIFQLNNLKIEYPEYIYNLKNIGIYVYSFNEEEIFRYNISNKVKIESKLDSYYKVKMEKVFDDLLAKNNFNLKTV